MVIGILQPGYLPWLGFFEQVYKSDVFVIYDDVQYDKHSWRNRNRIKTPQGALWLTVPVITRFEDRTLTKDILIDNKTNWRKKHLLSIRHNYSRAPFFLQYIPLFEETYSREWETLIDLDLFLIERLINALGMTDKRLVRSSTLKVTGARVDRLIAICKRFQADTFYEGASGKNYIDENIFSDQGIRVVYQEYSHPVYRQIHGDFVPYLSLIDLLFNHGPESLAILTNRATEVPK
jgi:hypothetical protein